MDNVSAARRSQIMGMVRGRNTGPELVVRRVLRAMGCKYKLHLRSLPGSPDIVFPTRQKAIFVHGCFWHRHRNCSNARVPKTRKAFWIAKLEGNRRRDRRVGQNLRRRGWRAMTVWECQ